MNEEMKNYSRVLKIRKLMLRFKDLFRFLLQAILYAVGVQLFFNFGSSSLYFKSLLIFVYTLWFVLTAFDHVFDGLR